MIKMHLKEKFGMITDMEKSVDKFRYKSIMMMMIIIIIIIIIMIIIPCTNNN